MLGERRSNSLFAPTAPAEPERKPEQAEVHDISFEERTGRSLFAEAATAPRASELFFAPQEKGVTFAEALSQVQSYLSETYATLITEDNSDAKEQMKRRMARYLQENRIAVDTLADGASVRPSARRPPVRSDSASKDGQVRCRAIPTQAKAALASCSRHDPVSPQ